MVDLSTIPFMSQILSIYASVYASVMLIRTMAEAFIPHQIRHFLLSHLQNLFDRLSSSSYVSSFSSHGILTFIIEENNNSFNEVFEAAEVYLRSKISSSTEKIRVSKTPRDKNLVVGIERDQEIIDVSNGVELKWKLIYKQKEDNERSRRSFELNFRKEHIDMVWESYLPYVLSEAEELREKNKVLKLYSREGDVWEGIKLEHPATFDKLAMDPELKKALVEDLDRFVKRREFYKRVGKAWKRGYLLYGPPGTGKSSLIAAMANYLNFNIYNLELTDISSNKELRRLLVSSTNQSILVIEDIDCSVQLKSSQNQLILSGLFNFVNGLWSSCVDERIIVFTTNHKDRLDPAFLLPGRMDMHIHMSYCTPPGFRLLASNYLGICEHQLFQEIEGLIEKVEITPAEVAEQLMKIDDVHITLRGLIEFIRIKKMKHDDEVKAQQKVNKYQRRIHDDDDGSRPFSSDSD